MVIFSTQIKDALGLQIEKLPSEFLEKWHLYFFGIQETIKTLKNAGVIIIMSGTNDEVFRDLQKHRIVALMGEENILKSFPKALFHAKNILASENN